MLTFLFWNVMKRDIGDVVAEMVDTHAVDVVILAEPGPSHAGVLEAVNSVRPGFRLPFSTCDQIHLVANLPTGSVVALDETDRISARRLVLSGQEPILLVALHAISKLHASEASQQQAIAEVVRFVDRQEAREGHHRTILVGDFNMNPFEAGIIGAGGLHAVMTRERARKVSRTVAGSDYRFFYNPMWRCFGDGSPGPPGTCHYPRSEHVSYFWNVFDQILIRPDLLDNFGGESVTVLTHSGERSLLTSGGFPNHQFSDHLPLLFRLDV